MKTILKETEDKMLKSVACLKNNFSSIRVGRATPEVLKKISVDYYGTPTPIQQMATVSVPEPCVLLIQPWDKSVLKSVEKAILASDLGITPNNDGEVIRLVFPRLTEERRKELCKSVKKEGEDTKVAIRNIRRDAIEKIKGLKTSGEITEDDQKDAEKKIQKLTDRYCDDVDKAVGEKEKDVLSI